MNQNQKNKGIVYRITKIEYCPTRCGQPCMVDVEKTFYEKGKERTKMLSCDVHVNHVYENGRFVPKTTRTGERWDYQEFNFTTPVISVMGRNGIGEFVKEEFKRMFQEQRQREGW